MAKLVCSSEMTVAAPTVPTRRGRVKEPGSFAGRLRSAREFLTWADEAQVDLWEILEVEADIVGVLEETSTPTYRAEARKVLKALEGPKGRACKRQALKDAGIGVIEGKVGVNDLLIAIGAMGPNKPGLPGAIARVGRSGAAYKVVIPCPAKWAGHLAKALEAAAKPQYIYKGKEVVTVFIPSWRIEKIFDEA